MADLIIAATVREGRQRNEDGLILTPRRRSIVRGVNVESIAIDASAWALPRAWRRVIAEEVMPAIATQPERLPVHLAQRLERFAEMPESGDSGADRG